MVDMSPNHSGVADAGSSVGKGSLPWPVARIMRVLPLAPLEIAASGILRNALGRYPGMFSRLDVHADKCFAIDPVDCPFVFLLEPRPHRPRLRALASLDGQRWDARISGVMLVLLGLLDGTYDGDALFFSRDLLIEGDTAAVLALRNAIEDAELDSGVLLGAPDVAVPFVSGSVRGALDAMRGLFGAPVSVKPPDAAVR